MLEAFIDAPQRHDRVTVFPLIAPQAPMLPYLLSTEVPGSSALTVRERGEEPVPMLLARNNSIHALLIFAGEPFPGGNPGRHVERSILLAGKHVTQIPASSKEAGGWVGPDREAEITEWLESFPLETQQVGFLAFHGDQILGLEALGSANLYKPLHRRLLIRFLKKALNHPAETNGDLAALEAGAKKMVDAIEVADREPTKRVGLGDYWSLSGRVSGGELIYEGRLIHLWAHPAPGGATANPTEGGGGQCS